MNEILQKRIVEAANKICCTDCPFESIRNCKECVEKENAIKTANFALQNQWISVEEALPERSKYDDGEETPHSIYVIVRFENGAVAMAYYAFPTKIWYYGIGRIGYNSIEARITHWMEIPSLEGGKE